MALLNYIKKQKIIAVMGAVIALMLLVWIWDVSAPIRGNLAARLDLHRGCYKVLGYGLPPPSQREYAACLRKSYNVKFCAVAGCLVSETLVSYVDAYDSVVVEDVNRRFGRDVFKECSEQAERNWREQVKARKAQRRP